MKVTCLDDLTLPQKNEFETHMFGCRVCAAELTFYDELIYALRDDPGYGERFRTPHAAAAYVLEDLSPERKAEFELHLRDCSGCARNVMLGQQIVKQLLEFSFLPADGSRLLSALQFVHQRQNGLYLKCGVSGYWSAQVILLRVSLYLRFLAVRLKTTAVTKRVYPLRLLLQYYFASIVICEGDLATISGTFRYDVITPVAHTRFSISSRFIQQQIGFE